MTRPICSTGTKIRSPPRTTARGSRARRRPRRAAEHLLVAGDAMVDVDDEVAGRQPLEDVARDDAPERPGPADADGPEQLAIRDEDQAVRAAGESAVQAALDERDRRRAAAARRRARRPRPDGRPPPAGSARRAAWSEASTIRAPSACQPATASTSRAARPSGSDGSRQPKTSPDDSAPARHRASRRRLGLPGQLEGPRAGEPGLPVARRQVGRRPVLRQLAGLDRVRRAARRPGATGTRPPRRCLRARRGRAACPGRCGRGRSPAPGGPPRSPPRRRRPSRACRPPAARPSRRPVVGLGTLEAREVGGEALRQAGRRTPEAGPDGRRAAGGQQELRRRQEHGVVDRANGPLVGRVERAERIDLVAEELDPDRQRQRWREDVDDPAAPGELAAPRDLEDGHVAEIEQVAQQGVLVEPRAAPEHPRLGRQVVRARSCAAGAPGRPRPGPAHGRSARPPGPRPARRSRRRPARCARRPARSAARARRRPPDRPARRPAPRRPGRRSRRRGRSTTSRSPGPRARAPRRDTTSRHAARRRGRHGDPTRRGSSSGAAQPLAQRRERAGRRQQRRQRGQVRQSVAAPRSEAPPPDGDAARAAGRGRRRAPRRAGRPRPRRRPRRRRSRSRPRRRAAAWRAAKSSDLLGDATVAAAPAAERRRRALSHGAARPRADGSVRQPVFVRRTPSAPGGPSTSPGAASRSVSAGAARTC